MPILGRRIAPRATELPPTIPGARWIALTRGQFALVDEADYEALNRFAWVYCHHGYAFRASPGKKHPHIRMHRQILGIEDPRVFVDHINGDGLDNRRRNLRPTDATGNARNNRGNHARRGPYKGVHPSGRPGKPWAAKITVARKTLNLGRFTTAEEAASAYDAAARQHFGDFANLNFGQKSQQDEFFELITGRGQDELRASEELSDG